MLAFISFRQPFNVFDEECVLVVNADCHDVCQLDRRGMCEVPYHFTVFKVLQDEYSNPKPIRKLFFSIKVFFQHFQVHQGKFWVSLQAKH